jgi:hypothetical protein
MGWWARYKFYYYHLHLLLCTAVQATDRYSRLGRYFCTEVPAPLFMFFVNFSMA